MLLSCVIIVVGLYRCLGPDRTVLVAGSIGALSGLVAVAVVPSMIEPHELGERNLRYIERVYEPSADGEPGKTRQLRDLDPGAR